MLVVNLLGSPGSGKSSGAAAVFSKLKMAGVNAELVTEYAKDKCWEGNDAVFHCQEYIFGKQSFRQHRLRDKVDVIVTDSPLILSSFYCSDPVLGRAFDQVVTDRFNSYNNFNAFIKRVKPYSPAGRFETEAESDEKAKRLLQFLIDHDIYGNVYDGDKEGYDCLVADVLKELEKRGE